MTHVRVIYKNEGNEGLVECRQKYGLAGEESHGIKKGKCGMSFVYSSCNRYNFLKDRKKVEKTVPAGWYQNPRPPEYASGATTTTLSAGLCSLQLKFL